MPRGTAIRRIQTADGRHTAGALLLGNDIVPTRLGCSAGSGNPSARTCFDGPRHANEWPPTSAIETNNRADGSCDGRGLLSMPGCYSVAVWSSGKGQWRSQDFIFGAYRFN